MDDEVAIDVPTGAELASQIDTLADEQRATVAAVVERLTTEPVDTTPPAADKIAAQYEPLDEASQRRVARVVEREARRAEQDAAREKRRAERAAR